MICGPGSKACGNSWKGPPQAAAHGARRTGRTGVRPPATPRDMGCGRARGHIQPGPSDFICRFHAQRPQAGVGRRERVSLYTPTVSGSIPVSMPVLLPVVDHGLTAGGPVVDHL